MKYNVTYGQLINSYEVNSLKIYSLVMRFSAGYCRLSRAVFLNFFAFVALSFSLDLHDINASFHLFSGSTFE